MKSRATLKLTSASSRAMRTSRSASPTLSSEIFPSPRRFRKAFCSLPLKVSNMATMYGAGARSANSDLRNRHRFAGLGGFVTGGQNFLTAKANFGRAGRVTLFKNRVAELFNFGAIGINRRRRDFDLF